jgi:hypothetical protein
MSTISVSRSAPKQHASAKSWIAFFVLLFAIVYPMFVIADLIQNGNANATLGWLFAIINWVISLFPHAAPIVHHIRIVVPS